MPKKCPLFTHALAVSGGLSCYGSDCQMWDEERKDCGLKHPAQKAQKTKEMSSVLGLTKAQRDICYSDAPNPPSEPE